MGLFDGVRNTWRKSEAAVVLQNLLEIQVQNGLSDLDPAMTANKLIGFVWDSKPDIFNGKFGQRPHKISVAAAALVQGLHEYPAGNPEHTPIGLALGMLLREVAVNGKLYPLNSLDETILKVAVAAYMQSAERVINDPLNAELLSRFGI